jgi:hypothetical protein
MAASLALLLIATTPVLQPADGSVLAAASPQGNAHGPQGQLAVDLGLFSVRVGGQQMQLQPVLQRKQRVGDTVDQPAVEGQGSVDIAHQMVEVKRASTRNDELDHRPDRSLRFAERADGRGL